MTNREKILEKNEYEILNAIQQDLLAHECHCVLDIFSEYYVPCRTTCAECIKEWLDKEEEN